MVSKKKAEQVKELNQFMDKYPVIGILEMKSMPSAQLQEMRKQLKEKALIRMYKKNIIIRALEKSGKKNIEKLKNSMAEIPALIFSETGPFKLSNTLQENRTPARAKTGDRLDRDVEVKEGPTDIAAGPAIGQLQKMGLKTSVKDGKIKIESSQVIGKEGDEVSKELANVLSMLDIKPVEIGLKMVAAYEKGTIYKEDSLSISKESVLQSLKEAASSAFALSIELGIPTSDNIRHMISNACSQAKALSSLVEKDKGEEKEEEEEEEGKEKEEEKKDDKKKSKEVKK